MPRFFISYRRSDTGYVAAMIADKLTDRYGREAVFLDIDNIPLGVDFRQYIDNAVAGCDILLALIGDGWLQASDENGRRRLDDASDFLRIEIESAMNRKIPVIPVLTGNARMPVEAELPESLSTLAYRNSAELRSGPDFRSHLERLLTGVAAQFEKEPPLTPSRPNEAAAPERPFRNSNFFRKAFLLYRPNTIPARIFRVFFFIGILFFAFTFVLNFLLMLTRSGMYHRGDFTFFNVFRLFCIALGVVVIPAYLFCWLPAVLLDKKRE